HPILEAIDVIAAHSVGQSARWSNTIRTARSRTSGEYLFDLDMTPSSQRKEPPVIPDRFNLRIPRPPAPVGIGEFPACLSVYTPLPTRQPGYPLPQLPKLRLLNDGWSAS